MITPEQAARDYQAAFNTLLQVANTPGLSAAQRQAIDAGIDTVTLGYIDRLETEINALTSQYTQFISDISAIVGRIQSGGGLIAGVQNLTAIVNNAGSLVGAATGGGAKGFIGPAPTAHAPVAPAAPVAARAGRPPIRILCVHGVGHQEGDPQFEGYWRTAIASGVMRWGMDRPIQTRFTKYDDLFASASISAWDIARAVAKLTVSGVVHTIGDWFRPKRGLSNLRESVRWTAGMVVQWAEDDDLRAAARKRIENDFNDFQPDIVLAHSLGSLLCYETFAAHEPEEVADGKKSNGKKGILGNCVFVTFGSQIGNPFVRSTLGGRIRPLFSAQRWFHLFNRHDDAFTAALSVPYTNFRQVEAHFDVSGILDHDAGEYLRHPNTSDVVWRSISSEQLGARAVGPSAASLKSINAHAEKVRRVKLKKPRRRAVLVGINDYLNPADRLYGCVNDVFLMSSLLQECGFEADNIRVLLNERATAVNIVERLQWLLEGSDDEQDRVFYYSGHGAQIPGYGVGESVDHKDECLVAVDFDWTREKAVTDDQFYELYSQLPYTTRFLTILDCCHSGGMTRDGGPRVRGLNPPDDIRHRELRWEADEQMWVPRDFVKQRPIVAERRKKPTFFGEDGATNRIGRASNLRPDKAEFKKATEKLGHSGPFMPIIIQACQENQYSYEYRHGVQSYGAFTYSLGLILREKMRVKKPPTWNELIQAITKKLEGLQYDQEPCLVCPSKYKDDPIPWNVKKKK